MAGPRQGPPPEERNKPTMARQFALEVYRQSVAERRAQSSGRKGEGSVKLPAILKHTEGTATGKNIRAYVEPSKQHPDEPVTNPNPVPVSLSSSHLLP